MSRLRYTISRPVDPGFLSGGTYQYGSYTLGANTTVIAAALGANSEIFQFRWADTARLAVINKVSVSAAVSTTYFAAGVPLTLQLIKATAWTVAGTGGAALTPAALLKKRTDFASSLVAAGDVRYATTGALGAGTKTLETFSMSTIMSGAPITGSLSGQIFPPNTTMLETDPSAGQWPLILKANEGFIISAQQTPGTGTWSAAFNVDWTEVSAYPY